MTALPAAAFPQKDLADTTSGSNQRAVLVLIALLLWASGAAALFAENRLIMAFWFCLTHVLGPLALVLLGWMAHALAHAASFAARARVVGFHTCILLLAAVALPLLLGAINLLPFGRTTESWHGRVTANEQWIFGNYTYGSTVTVRSDDLGPHLRFRTSRADYYAIAQSGNAHAPVQVRGTVVRGFMGVPVSAWLDPVARE